MTFLRRNANRVFPLQAIGAIENALLDVVGKALGVPACALFGGPIRTELPVYWSHCGSFRVNFHQQLTSPHRGNKPVPPLRSGLVLVLLLIYPGRNLVFYADLLNN